MTPTSATSWCSTEAYRERQETAYQAELSTAIINFLAFADAHLELAERIAEEASGRAAVVGSGRVGRTRTITLEERAALASRAYIRHRFTSYEDDLFDTVVWDDDFLYREVKANAQRAVDDFLAEHRVGAHLSGDPNFVRDQIDS